MSAPNQPLLHDLVALCAAPTQLLSGPDGTIAPRQGTRATAQGLFHADVRVLSEWRLTVAGEVSAPLATELVSEARARHVALVTGVAGSEADRCLRLDVDRRVLPGQLRERISISSSLSEPATVSLRLELAADLAPMQAIKVGQGGDPVRFNVDVTADGHDVAFGNDDVTARLVAPEAETSSAEDSTRLVLTWPATIDPGDSFEVSWTLTVEDAGAVVVPADGAGLPVEAIVARVTADGSDPRLRPWLRQSLKDLNGLRLATRDDPDDAFFAAGAPWYFTLFGRDSLWTSRLLLGVDVDQAGGTLRTLGRLAGTRVDATTAEEPGKIPHELRRGSYAFGDTSLPPLYYGTVDATPLWICLLHDAWRAGLAERQIVELLPVLEGALGWLTDYGDADGDGFLEYVDTSGHGLTNQGWKDSADAVRFADGRIAEGPVALCEVQGYAYEAAIAGAELLAAFGRSGAEAYRAWAATLADRFRADFWCGEGDGRYPAMALDGDKCRVDAVTSNIGHLLGTGLLDADEEALVAGRVARSELDSGLGLRTMSTESGGYSPLSYHCGSVWPHDTAIVIAGLRRCGRADEATGLVEGLLAASLAFGHRLPELWSGEGNSVPYPAACRPQAWSAAAAVTVAEWFRRH